MIKKIKKTIKSHNILPTRSVLVALSGGADSVALLHIMHTLSKEYGFKLYAAHVNHNLRGEAAKKDEIFSQALCHRLGIQCFVKSADVKSVAKAYAISEEMAGRRVRYEFFSELMQEYDIEYTATAHHKNDNAETIIMNFLRGSSLSGLSGIPYRRDSYIRPLLDVTRSEIEGYCKENGLDYVTDITNSENVYTRNKIRNILIPQLEREYNPNIVDTLTANAHIISEDENFISNTVDTEYDKYVKDSAVSVNDLMSLHKAISKRIIRKMIDNNCGASDVSSVVIDSVYELCKKNKTGASCNIIKDITARIEYSKLIIGKETAVCDDFSYTVKIGECVYIPEVGYSVSVKPTTEGEADKNTFKLPCGIDEITVTNRRIGDKFIPSGMTGTKSLKGFMIDKKIPQNERSRIGIVRIGGEIAWVIGYRRDERFKGNDIVIKID